LYAVVPNQAGALVANEDNIDGAPNSTNRGNSPLPVPHRDRERRTETSIQPCDVRLHGEVLANEDQGGPRLVVDVEPIDSSGGPVAFAGTLSLMMLAPDVDDEPQNLARWDFSAKEVRAAVESANAPTMRFYLELPAQTAPTEPTELWVRLMPQNGDKLLTHAQVLLAQVGEFSSTGSEPVESVANEAVELASFEGQTDAVLPQPAVDLANGWTIARPDSVVPIGAETSPASEWRATSETIPVVTRAAPATEQIVGSRPDIPAAAKAHSESPQPYKRPTWTAERPTTTDAAKARTKPQGISQPQRPLWSATR
jgi:hypothetical protein